MMGHETLQMIHERYYSYIKNYQRDDGKAFMENVYNNAKDKKIEETGEKGSPNRAYQLTIDPYDNNKQVELFK